MVHPFTTQKTALQFEQSKYKDIEVVLIRENDADYDYYEDEDENQDGLANEDYYIYRWDMDPSYVCRRNENNKKSVDLTQHKQFMRAINESNGFEINLTIRIIYPVEHIVLPSRIINKLDIIMDENFYNYNEEIDDNYRCERLHIQADKVIKELGVNDTVDLYNEIYVQGDVHYTCCKSDSNVILKCNSLSRVKTSTRSIDIRFDLDNNPQVSNDVQNGVTYEKLSNMTLDFGFYEICKLKQCIINTPTVGKLYDINDIYGSSINFDIGYIRRTRYNLPFISWEYSSDVSPLIPVNNGRFYRAVK